MYLVENLVLVIISKYLPSKRNSYHVNMIGGFATDLHYIILNSSEQCTQDCTWNWTYYCYYDLTGFKGPW